MEIGDSNQPNRRWPGQIVRKYLPLEREMMVSAAGPQRQLGRKENGKRIWKRIESVISALPPVFITEMENWKKARRGYPGIRGEKPRK